MMLIGAPKEILMKTLEQSRYQPNAEFGGRKECDGFVCSSITRKTILGQNCVAVKMDGPHVRIRDTKDETDTTLSFTKDEWTAFVEGVKKGEFDSV